MSLSLKGIYITIILFGYVFITSIESLLNISNVEGVSLYITLYRAICILTFFLLIFISKRNYTQYQLIFLTLFFILWLGFYLRVILGLHFSEHSYNLNADSYFKFGLLIVFMGALSLLKDFDENDVDSFINSALVVLFISTAFASFSAFTSIYSGDNNLTRLGLSKLNPISLGKSAGVLLILSYFKIRLHKKSYQSVKLLFYTLALYSVTVLLLSGSRGALLASVTVIGYDLSKRFSFKQVILTVASLPPILILVNYIMSKIFTGFSIIERLSKTGGKMDQSANIRYKLYEGAWEQFSWSPIFGDFYIERAYLFYPHNSLLEVLMSMGVFGGVIFILIFSMVAYRAHGIDKCENSLSTKVLISLFIFYFIISLFSGSLFLSAEIWCFSFVIIFYKTFTERNVYK